MSQFIPYITTSNINSVPIAAGQFIYCTVDNTIYIDLSDSVRQQAYANVVESDSQTYTTKSSFPATVKNDKLYIDTTAKLMYSWDGSEYSPITATPDILNAYTKQEIDAKIGDIVSLMEVL